MNRVQEMEIMPRQYSEADLRDYLFRVLYKNLVSGQSALKDGATHFVFACRVGKGDCIEEGSLSYSLPSGVLLSHKSDILISLPTDMYFSLELKFLSAVTDQLKTRSYDMIHLKRSHGAKLIGIMVYVHGPGVGISLDRARAICYPFDYFVGLKIKDLLSGDFWNPVTGVIHNGLRDLGI
jgi:hypothetical protein